MINKNLELFQELLDTDKEVITKFAKNSAVFSSQFSSQFKLSKLNETCFDKMYINGDKSVVPRQNYVEVVDNLEQTCKDCWNFYLNPRNKSIKGLDIQLGKVFERIFRKFLDSKGINCKEGDEQDKRYPDNKVIDGAGNTIAYLEIKYQSAPWIFAYKEEKTNRECYEGSPALDIGKLENQWEIFINGGSKIPIYYVFWLDFPCIKGVFFISIKDVYQFYKKEAKPFRRKERDGDFNKKMVRVGHIDKIHISIYKMGTFGELLTLLRC